LYAPIRDLLIVFTHKVVTIGGVREGILLGARKKICPENNNLA